MPFQRFITFEGGEGAGKSTQIRNLEKHVLASKQKVIVTREPGGSRGAERIRDLLVKQNDDAWLPYSDLFLFAAARVDHWEKLIKPKLEEGFWVLCDRYIDSTLCYQGAASGINQEFIRHIFEQSCKDAYPSRTYFLDISPDVGLQRAIGRFTSNTETRYEQKDLSFHHHVRTAFHRLLEKNPQRFMKVDASESTEKVSKAILDDWESYSDIINL